MALMNQPQGRSRLTTLLALVGIVSVVVLAALSVQGQRVEVEWAEVSRQTFSRTFVEEGESVYRERRVVAAPVDGLVPNLSINVGDSVVKGQELFRISWDRPVAIRSPLSGLVLRVFERDERTVVRGTPLLEVGDPQSLEVKASVLSENVVHLRVGDKARVINWGGEGALGARIRLIEPIGREVISALGVKEHRVDVYLERDAGDGEWPALGNGFRVEVEFLLETRENVIALPIGALVRHQNGVGVYVLEGGKARLKAVEVVSRNRDWAEVGAGVGLGAKVVLYPSPQLKEGMRVRMRGR